MATPSEKGGKTSTTNAGLADPTKSTLSRTADTGSQDSTSEAGLTGETGGKTSKTDAG